jgi:hypothetical protein
MLVVLVDLLLRRLDDSIAMAALLAAGIALGNRPRDRAARQAKKLAWHDCAISYQDYLLGSVSLAVCGMRSSGNSSIAGLQSEHDAARLAETVLFSLLIQHPGEFQPHEQHAAPELGTLRDLDAPLRGVQFRRRDA